MDRRCWRRCWSLAAVIAADVAYAVLRNTVPSPSGTLAIAGLSAPVEVVRDREGVPHIFAEDHRRSLLRARVPARAGPPVADGADAPRRPGPPVGDFRRAHVRHRRLPAHARSLRPRRAVAGGALPRDQARASRPMRAASTPSSSRKTGLLEPRLPPEFLLLRHEPEPWRVADSLVTAKMMALNLSTNLNHEMTAAGARRGRPDLGGDRGPAAARRRRMLRRRCPSWPSSIPCGARAADNGRRPHAPSTT